MSDTQAIFEQVKAIIVDQLGVDADDVTMEASFRDDLEAAAPGRYRGPGADLCRYRRYPDTLVYGWTLTATAGQCQSPRP